MTSQQPYDQQVSTMVYRINRDFDPANYDNGGGGVDTTSVFEDACAEWPDVDEDIISDAAAIWAERIEQRG